MIKKLLKIFIACIPYAKLRRNLRGILESERLAPSVFRELREQIDKFEPVVYNCAESKHKILHYGTYKVKCGIASFLDDVLLGLEENGEKYNAVVPVNYDYLKDTRLIKAYLDKLTELVKDFDVLFIQHEYAFWLCRNFYLHSQEFIRSDSLYEKYVYNPLSFSLVMLDYAVKKCLGQNKKIVIVWHYNFNTVLDSFLNNNKVQNYTDIPFFRFIAHENIKIIVMNKSMTAGLKQKNIPITQVKYLPHPVPCRIILSAVPFSLDFVRDGDVVIGGFGFVEPYKSLEKVIEALKFLPENYKYLHVGGVRTQEAQAYYEKLKTLAAENGLSARVHFTGFVNLEDIPSYFKTMTLGVYITVLENYASGAINQLLINNIPTIAINSSGFWDLSSDYDCIELVDSAEPELLAQKIRELAVDIQRQNTLKRNMEQFVQKNTFKNFTKELWS